MPRLPSNGPMTIDMIRNEFKRGPSLAPYLNMRHDAGVFPGSNLAFSNFYGRQSAFVVDHLTLGATDWDLYEWTRALGWDGVQPVVGFYGAAPGAVIQCSSIDLSAMRVYGFPEGSVITIRNFGYIVGHGGAGGGDIGEPFGPEGGRGGNAILVRSRCYLENYGVIGGGGGGGLALPDFFGFRARGGGGATNGWPNGGLSNGPGESGGAAAVRRFGPGQGGIDAGATRGGNGGLWGETGQGWFDYNNNGPNGAGGPPGSTIDGASLCSSTVYGDTRGYNVN